MTLFHGNGIFFEGHGLLLTGPSGSGKSDLSLRLMGLGAQLVGDDYVDLAQNEAGRLVMAAPRNIAGRIEVRHVGILPVEYLPTAEVDLILKLLPRDRLPQNRLQRLPEPEVMILEDVAVPCLDFDAFVPSAPEKIRAAIKIMPGSD